MPFISSNIFRVYDIRGVAGETVTEEVCERVGKAFGSELRERYQKEHPTVILSRDTRTHSPALMQATEKGLLSAGCRVQRIGEVASPVNYFANCHFKSDGSIQITASHNPGTDNGLKLQLRDAEAFSGENLQRLRRRVEGEQKGHGTWDSSTALGTSSGHGISEDLDGVTPYMERVTSLVADRLPLTALKVVADFGNGVAGPVYTAALRTAGIQLIPLFENPDGTFPNHIADPSKHETLQTLQETVKKENADCGIAFDGDGDRVGFVDEGGRVISPDLLLLLLAEDHLSRHPGAPIIYTVSMSGILETEITRMGGQPVMCIVGHSFVEEAMRKHGSHLGGEQSGHFFCGENFYHHDDALVAALRVLSIFARRKRGNAVTLSGAPPHASSSHFDNLSAPLSMTQRGGDEVSFSSLFRNFPKVYQSPEWRPHCDDDQKGEVIRKATEHFAKHYPCITMDGVRVDFGDGAWALIRQSNTSPTLSICMEARTEEKFQWVRKIVREHLRAYPEIDREDGCNALEKL